MTYSEYTDNLERIKYLAEHKQTGSPYMLAKTLRVSVRTVLRMVKQLREHGYPIKFNRFRNTYEVEND